MTKIFQIEVLQSILLCAILKNEGCGRNDFGLKRVAILTSDEICRPSLRRAHVTRDSNCPMANLTAHEYTLSDIGTSWRMLLVKV